MFTEQNFYSKESRPNVPPYGNGTFEKKEQSFAEKISIDHSMEAKLGETIDRWWENACQSAESSLSSQEKYKLGDVMIKLAENVLEHGDGKGEVKVMFEKGKIVIEVRDYNEAGFENPVQTLNISIANKYDLGDVAGYVDRFIIETQGKRYEKVAGQLSPMGTSSVFEGSRITCEKRILGNRIN